MTSLDLINPDTVERDTPVSVVIPLYNGIDTVTHAAQSVLNQTHSNLELIVVDDGSTDLGAHQLHALHDRRLRVVRQPNAGVSAARNRGIEEATHELIAFLDADDLWRPDHLAAIVRLHGNHPGARAYATAYTRRQPGLPERAVRLRGLAPDFQGPLENYFALATRSEPPVCSSSVAATKTALLAIGGFPRGVGQGEDLLTWARLACHADIAYDAQPSVVIHPPHTPDGAPVRTPPAVDTVGQKLHHLLEEAAPARRPALRRYIAHWRQMRASMFVRLGDHRAARREIRHALPRDPFNKKLWAWTALSVAPKAGT
ncbi:MAG: glycosyltransferase family A protein, partial [Planctomycetota bacterium]